MANKNVQIKVLNNFNEFDNIYPKSRAEIIEGLPELLEGKVDKVSGKTLSTFDYTLDDKMKLDSISPGANSYVHPTNHPPSIIAQDINNMVLIVTGKHH